MSTMSRDFTFTGLVYVAMIALVAFGLGMTFRTLTPKLVGAAPAGAVMSEGVPSDMPVITSVEATNGGWNVQLDNQAVIFIESRVVSTGGKAPALAQLQAFDDQLCVFGQCAGYATLVDADGTSYAGYRK